MKIGMFLDTSFPPDPRVENEATSLINEGHEVFLFTLNRKGKTGVETVNGIQVVHYKSNWLLYKLSALVYTFSWYKWLVKPMIKHFISTYQVGVLHVHDMILADVVLVVNKAFNLPTVLDLHENRPAIMRYYKHVNSFSGKLLIHLKKWERKQRSLIMNYDNIIVVTEEAKETIQKEQPSISKNKITVVPNSIRKALFFNYEIDQSIVSRFAGQNNIIYVGDTGLRRGLDTVIKAIGLLKRQEIFVHFIVVGKGADDKFLKALTVELGVDDLVHMVGWQDLTLFPSYMASAQVGISPIKRNLHHDTTFANKVFQFMAMKLPLLVSDCPPQERVVKESDCGLVYKADDELDLAEKLKQLMSDPEKRSFFGHNGYEAISDAYHWDAVSQPLIHLYAIIEDTYA